MVTIPEYDNYSVEYLIVLGNQTTEEITKQQIILAISKKILNSNKSIFYLINKFKFSNDILREVYAKVVVMKLVDNEYYIDDKMLDEILNLVSLDDLVHYGMEAMSLNIRERSTIKLYQRGMNIEDKNELDNKIV